MAEPKKTTETVPLTLFERLMIISTMPDKGTRATMQTIDDFIRIIGPTMDEEKLAIRKCHACGSYPPATSTGPGMAIPRLFTFSTSAFDILKDKLIALDASGGADGKPGITRGHLTLWTKFVEGKYVEPEQQSSGGPTDGDEAD